MTTVGDKLKCLKLSLDGTYESDHVEPHRRDNFVPINTIQATHSSLSGSSELEYMFLLQQISLSETSNSVVYTVEAANGGLYDVKFYKLAHRGDSSKYFGPDSGLTAEGEAQSLFEQFASLDYYYKEANKLTVNICPTIYKYRIHPFDAVLQHKAHMLNRVFEVEEHMGNNFMDELAQMHQDNLKVVEHAMMSNTKRDDKQKSLPAYLQGSKLAVICKQLEEVKCHGGPEPLKGAGKVIFDPEIHFLRGEMAKVTENSYFRFDRERYLQCLANFRKGWDYYLSVLEIQIIECKLMTILDSLTFKYTRQPQFLRVFPDRLTTQNVKILKKIKLAG